MLKESIGVISPDSLIVTEEFSDWIGSQRRIDLIGIDKYANLVVIELKRSQYGGFMDLQSIRYASMISTMTMERAIDVYSDYLGQPHPIAQDQLLAFLGWDQLKEE